MDKHYPLESRKKIEKFYIGKQSLEGGLRLEGFFNLTKLCCSNNQLTSLGFILQISDPKGLGTLIVNNNKLVCHLSDFSSLTNLKILKLGNNKFDTTLEYLPHNLKAIYCQGCMELEEKLKGFEMKDKNEKCYDVKK
ncbi:MAG: hypothetical protein NY202_05345 [Mollicutes bacterium UO1]